MNQLLKWCIGQADLQLIKEHGNKFLYILLDQHVNWLSKWLIGYTEVPWGEVNPVSFLQICEYLLNLMKEVIIHNPSLIFFSELCLSMRFFIISPQEQIPKTLIKKELLNHRVHIASIGKVFHPSIASSRPLPKLATINNFHLLLFILDCFFHLLHHFINIGSIIIADF